MIFLNKKRIDYTPWEDEEWSELFRQVEIRLDKERVYTLLQYLELSLKEKSDIIEMGVYRGCTAAAIGNGLKKNNSESMFYLCDTFEGTPACFNSTKGDINRKGRYTDTSAEYVENKMKKFYSNCCIVKGFIPDSLESISDKTFCFAHVHLNLYESTINALKWLSVRMDGEGIVVVEDYGIKNCLGVRRAVDELVEAEQFRKIYLPTGQAVLFLKKDL